MLKLGQLTLDVPFFQASLSGHSDYAMRKLAASYGAPLTFAGVVLAKSAAHPNVLNNPAFRPQEDECLVGAQILGDEPQIMAGAAKTLVQAGFSLIDLNFACPAPKILRRRRGGFLLNDPQTVVEIFKQVRNSVTCPVLMKLRIGFDDSSASRDNFWKIVSQASAEGVDALVVHPRSVLQRFKGSADWQVLAELKRKFPKTTIIGSGDLFDAQIIAERLRTSGIDGVTIARGAIGNPWIFRDLRAVLEGKPVPPPPSLDEQASVMLRHFELLAGLYQPKKALRYFRKFIVGYCKLHPQRRKAQKALITAADNSQLFAAIVQWYGVS